MIIPLNDIVDSWPWGARLRFKLDANVQAKYRHLRGTLVAVIGGPILVPPRDGNTSWAVRQEVLAYAWGRGRARPEHLEPRPDDPRPPKMVQVKRATTPPAHATLKRRSARAQAVEI